jgi:hypothetical protein
MRSRCSGGCGRNVPTPGRCQWCQAKYDAAAEIVAVMLAAGGGGPWPGDDDQADDEDAS